MKILYAGPFSYPSSNANSLRIRGMVRSLQLSDHEVTVASWDVGSDSLLGSAENLSEKVYGMSEYENGFMSSFSKGIRGIFLGDCLIDWLNSKAQKYDLIVLYGTHLGYLSRLLRYCNGSQIPLILDVVEWYSLEDLPGGRFGPYAISHEVSMRYLAHKADGVFAISRRLENHFKSKGARVLRVPPLFDKNDLVDIGKYSELDGKLHLCYVGSPGKKECLGLIVKALGIAKSKGVEFRLHLAGFGEEEFVSTFSEPLPDFINSQSGYTIFYGRIPNQDARKLVQKSDFSLLVRPDRRANQFGFPSKMPESMMLGTPVIANLFSDLADYLVNENNSILVEKLDADSLASIFLNVSRLMPEAKRLISDNARILALSEFSTKSNVSKIDEFIKLICVSNKKFI